MNCSISTNGARKDVDSLRASYAVSLYISDTDVSPDENALTDESL
jgi:hypothetical protein